MLTTIFRWLANKKVTTILTNEKIATLDFEQHYWVKKDA